MNEKVNQHFSCDDDAYFLSHSVGKLPRNTSTEVERCFFSVWNNHASAAWPSWLEQIELFHLSLSKLFNSQTHLFCPQSNVSSGLSKVFGSLSISTKRNCILFSENDFPSVGFVIRKAKQLGFKVAMIPANENTQDLDVWQKYLDDSIHSVLVTHVQYLTGKKIPVAEICNLAQENDIYSIIDVAQSSGIIPIDFEKWNPSFVVGSCIKWLCGGPGAGFLWVNQNILEKSKPIDVGWFSHKKPFEFDISNFEYAEDANRFWGGTPSIIPFVIARYSIDAILNIGHDEITAHNQKLTNIMTYGLDPSLHYSPIEYKKRGGTTILSFDNICEVQNALNEAKVGYDQRDGRLRFSPHIYTSEKDAKLLNEILINATRK